MHRRVIVSHTRTVLSADAVNSSVPNTSSAHTISSCPYSTCRPVSRPTARTAACRGNFGEFWRIFGEF